MYVCMCVKKTTAIIFSTSLPNVFIFIIIIIIRSYFVRPGCKTSHPSHYTEYTIHGALIFIHRVALTSCETFSIHFYVFYLFFKSDYVCCYLIINDILSDFLSVNIQRSMNVAHDLLKAFEVH